MKSLVLATLLGPGRARLLCTPTVPLSSDQLVSVYLGLSQETPQSRKNWNSCSPHLVVKPVRVWSSARVVFTVKMATLSLPQGEWRWWWKEASLVTARYCLPTVSYHISWLFSSRWSKGAPLRGWSSRGQSSVCRHRGQLLVRCFPLSTFNPVSMSSYAPFCFPPPSTQT